MRVTWARLTPDHQMRAKTQWEDDQEKEIDWQRETNAQKRNMTNMTGAHAPLPANAS